MCLMGNPVVIGHSRVFLYQALISEHFGLFLGCLLELIAYHGSGVLVKAFYRFVVACSAPLTFPFVFPYNHPRFYVFILSYLLNLLTS